MFETHPYVKTPPDDTLIWRYVDLERMLSLVTSRQLYLPRLDQFQDPREGSYSAAFESAIKTIGAAGVEFLKISRETTYVSCWHASPHESAALWDQYARSGGIAIRSTVGRPKQAITSPNRFFIGSVWYGVNRPNIATVNHLEPAFWKRDSFEHEKEVRLAVVDFDSSIVGANPKGIALDVDLTVLMEAVLISPLSKPWIVGPIKSLFEPFGLSSIPIVPSGLYDPK